MSKTTSSPLANAKRSTMKAQEPARRVNSTLERLREMRLKKMTAQVEKLNLELERIKKTHVDLEAIKREVIAANVTVKRQVLSVPIREALRLGLTREQVTGLNQALTNCLNELAYESTQGDSSRAVNS